MRTGRSVTKIVAREAFGAAERASLALAWLKLAKMGAQQVFPPVWLRAVMKKRIQRGTKSANPMDWTHGGGAGKGSIAHKVSAGWLSCGPPLRWAVCGGILEQLSDNR